ncbi:5837_t:CDS:2 [Ambispora gerdemannii]|uniref:5837_t:CDS:1 n=1 Tax=Ambispora gerdemannii TaxID=144530 RepID=A0A9N9CDH5_9GLOM|nr:5837_t:CDS:2 [Ambispora gerdemannii]
MNAKQIFSFLLMVVVVLSVTNADELSITAPSDNTSVGTGSTTKITCKIQKSGLDLFDTGDVKTLDDAGNVIETVFTVKSTDFDTKNPNVMSKDWVVDSSKYVVGNAYTITFTGDGTRRDPSGNKKSVTMSAKPVTVTVVA